MKKKIFTLFLALVASVGTMFASDTQVDGIWYDFDEEDLTASVTYRGDSYDTYVDEYSGSVVIPSTVTYNYVKYSVTSIGYYAFYGCSGLTSVTIPNGVTSIGYYAFYGCSGLTSVTIPNSVTSIGHTAFYGCSGLTSVTIPNSVTSIGDVAFSGCKSLTSVTIPNSVTSIGHATFYGCSGLTSVTIGNGVTSIDTEALFRGCISLNSIIVESGNTVYDSRNNCNAIIETASNTLIVGCQSTIIPNSVTSIRWWAFEDCSSLTSVTIPNSVTSIGYGAFSECTGLTSVTIPNSVTSIGYGAFSDCTGLTSVTIGNSVTSIEESTFEDCSNLKNVIIGSSVKVLEDHAFYNCSSIESITCYSMRPPTVNTDALYGLDYSTIVYVPADYLETYKMHDAWGLYDVRPLGAKTIETTDVNVTPAENTAEVAWPAISGAATYELVIKDKSGNVICTLVFNANGQLTQIAFNAPARNNAPQQTQAAGFSFTVTGLESGTSYDLTITSKDNNGGTLDTKTVSFTTTGEAPQGIDQVPSDQVQSTKVIRNGQIYILRGEKVYTVTGQEVR